MDNVDDNDLDDFEDDSSDMPPLVEPPQGTSMTFTFSTDMIALSSSSNPGVPESALPVTSESSASLPESSVLPPPTRRRQDNDHIPRPPNAFILFRSAFIRSQKISGKVEGNNTNLSKIIGMYWKALPASEREEWEAKAVIAQAEHRRRYPDWRFRPGSGARNKATGKRRKKKVKDGDEDWGPDEDPGDGSPPSLTLKSGRRKGKAKDRDVSTPSASSKSKGKSKVVSRRDRRNTKIKDLLVEGKDGTDLELAVEEWEENRRARKRKKTELEEVLDMEEEQNLQKALDMSRREVQTSLGEPSGSSSSCHASSSQLPASEAWIDEEDEAGSYEDDAGLQSLDNDRTVALSHSRYLPTLQPRPPASPLSPDVASSPQTPHHSRSPSFHPTEPSTSVSQHDDLSPSMPHTIPHITLSGPFIPLPIDASPHIVPVTNPRPSPLSSVSPVSPPDQPQEPSHAPARALQDQRGLPLTHMFKRSLSAPANSRIPYPGSQQPQPAGSPPGTQPSTPNLSPSQTVSPRGRLHSHHYGRQHTYPPNRSRHSRTRSHAPSSSSRPFVGTHARRDTVSFPVSPYPPSSQPPPAFFSFPASSSPPFATVPYTSSYSDAPQLGSNAFDRSPTRMWPQREERHARFEDIPHAQNHNDDSDDRRRIHYALEPPWQHSEDEPPNDPSDEGWWPSQDSGPRAGREVVRINTTGDDSLESYAQVQPQPYYTHGVSAWDSYIPTPPDETMLSPTGIPTSSFSSLSGWDGGHSSTEQGATVTSFADFGPRVTARIAGSFASEPTISDSRHDDLLRWYEPSGLQPVCLQGGLGSTVDTMDETHVAHSGGHPPTANS